MYITYGSYALAEEGVSRSFVRAKYSLKNSVLKMWDSPVRMENTKRGIRE